MVEGDRTLRHRISPSLCDSVAAFMKINILHAGYCTSPEHLAIQGGRWKTIHFPAMFVLLRHPKFGPMLFDTGYSYRFFDETKKFPKRLYRFMTPVFLEEEELLVNQLL